MADDQNIINGFEEFKSAYKLNESDINILKGAPLKRFMAHARTIPGLETAKDEELINEWLNMVAAANQEATSEQEKARLEELNKEARKIAEERNRERKVEEERQEQELEEARREGHANKGEGNEEIAKASQTSEQSATTSPETSTPQTQESNILISPQLLNEATETQTGNYPMNEEPLPLSNSEGVSPMQSEALSAPEQYSPPNSTPAQPTETQSSQNQPTPSHTPPAPRASNKRKVRGAGIKKRMASKVARKLAKEAIKKFAMTPYGMACIGIAIAIIIFFAIILSLLGAGQASPEYSKELGLDDYFGNSVTPEPGPAPDLPEYIYFKGGSAYIIGPDGCVKTCSASTGEPIAMTIYVTINKEGFQGDISKVTANVVTISDYFSVTDVKGNPTRTNYPTLGIDMYKWKFVPPALRTGNNDFNFTITGKVIASSGDSDVKLSMSGVTLTNGPDTGSGATTGNIWIGKDSPPSSDHCGSRNWPLPNFGDPLCSYSPADWKKVLDLTETNHPEFIPFWQDIANTEGNVNTRSGSGYGKFQMNATFPRFSQKNMDNNIRGDVPWQRQIQNAVSRNNYLISQGNSFGFWGTAMCMCYFDYYRNSAKGKWCNDIINQKQKVYSVRCPNVCARKSNPSSPSCSTRTDDHSHGAINCSQYACWDGNTYKKH